MLLSEFKRHKLRKILVLYDKCVGGNSLQAGITIEEIVKDLRVKGISSRPVGSKLTPHSRLEFYMDMTHIDPTVEIDFIPMLSTLEDPKINEARRLVTKFRDSLKELLASMVEGAPVRPPEARKPMRRHGVRRRPLDKKPNAPTE